MIHFEKSLLFFSSNVNNSMQVQIAEVLGVRTSTSLEKYLRLLVMVGKRKKEAFKSFKNRVEKHLECWSNRFLSIGGK